MTVPGAIDVIRDLAKSIPDMAGGRRHVLDVETARRCLDAGASVPDQPGLDLEIVNFALGSDVVVFPGALTPTEVMAAWKAGSDFVKVFPCAANWRPRLHSGSQGCPFRNVPLIASGGVNQTNAGRFHSAGAVALGIGRDLIHQDAFRRRSRAGSELARRYPEDGESRAARKRREGIA